MATGMEARERLDAARTALKTYGMAPRRRRSIVCHNLTVNGDRWSVEDARDRMKETLKGDKSDLRCTKRPGVAIAADWALDMCLSSMCRDCVFHTDQPGDKKPEPAVTDNGLTPTEKRLFAVLLENCGIDGWPAKNDWLAGMIGSAHGSVTKYARTLEKRGLIRVEDQIPGRPRVFHITPAAAIRYGNKPRYPWN